MSADENGGSVPRHISCCRKRSRDFGHEESEQLPRGSCGAAPCNSGDASARLFCKATCPSPPAPAPCSTAIAQARQAPAGASVSMARCTFLPSQGPAQTNDVAAVASCPSTPTFVVNKALHDDLKSLSTNELMALSRQLDEQESELKHQLRAHQARYLERFAPSHDGVCCAGLAVTDAAATTEDQTPGTQPPQPRARATPGFPSPPRRHLQPPLFMLPQHPQPSPSRPRPTSPAACDYRPMPPPALPPPQTAHRPLAPPVPSFTQHLIPHPVAPPNPERPQLGTPLRASTRPPLPPPPPRPPAPPPPPGMARATARMIALGSAPTTAARAAARPPPTTANLIRVAMPPPALPCGVGVGRQAIALGTPVRVRVGSGAAGRVGAQVPVVGPGGGGGLAPTGVNCDPLTTRQQPQTAPPGPPGPKCPPSAAPSPPLPLRTQSAMPAPPPPCGTFFAAPAGLQQVGIRAMIPHTLQPRVATVMPVSQLGPGGSLVTLGGGVFRLGMRSVMRLQQEARQVSAGQVQQGMVPGAQAFGARHTPVTPPSGGTAGGGV